MSLEKELLITITKCLEGTGVNPEHVFDAVMEVIKKFFRQLYSE